MADLGWFDTVAQAVTYFQTERASTECWDELTAESGNIADNVLRHAYNRLYYSPRYDLPTKAEATAAELVVLRKAQAEMAYYLACHIVDEDRRMGLQAQHVKKAGIVKEDYREATMNEAPIPGVVDDLLAGWKTAKAIHIKDIDRDEEKCVGYDVVECDED